MDIRPAVAADAGRLAAIYAHYVYETVVTFDTEARSVDEWECRVHAAAEAGHPFLVGEEDGRVVGYALVSG